MNREYLIDIQNFIMQLSVTKKFQNEFSISKKSASLMRMFGLTSDKLNKGNFTYSCSLNTEDGDIIYITGPSGSGKSVLLGQMEKNIPKEQRINLNDIVLPVDKPVVDCIDGDLMERLNIFITAGLSDCWALLTVPANLSEGQKYRYRLAVALASKRRFIFADEFCCNLDRITAATLSYNIRKFAGKYSVTFFLASSHDDTLIDLAPDVIVTRDLTGSTDVTYKHRTRGIKK